MKIQLMSDLHLEFGWMIDFTPHPDTTLVLAGDITNNMIALDGVIDRACKNYKWVVYVTGNHEYYLNEYLEVNDEIKDFEKYYDNFTFLNNEFVVLDGVTFIGSTLWSYPDRDAFQRINDKRVITFHGRGFGVDDIRNLNLEATLFIKEAIEKIKGPKVVVTHFGPDPRLMNPRWFSAILLNTYFWARGFENHFQDVDLWLFGHTHDPTDTYIDGCRCVCNPHGYKYPDGQMEHKNFDPELILEI